MSTTAVCSGGFDWAFNSLDQSPCQIAEFLGGVCNGGVFTVPPLDGTEVYTGPDPSFATPCRCSTVFYSLTCACAACQEHKFETWSAYSQNCSSVYVGPFPKDIPSGTAVPDYAYQVIPAGGTFNLPLAQTDTGPESVAPPQPTITGPASSSTSPSSGSSGKSKTNVGAIAGGVVGGVVFLGLVASLIWFLMRRRSRSTPPALTNLNAGGGPLTPPPMSYTSPSPFSAIQSTKLYDPADPSTFPSSPSSAVHSAVHTTYSETQPFIQPTFTGASHPDTRQPQYSGAPEL